MNEIFSEELQKRAYIAYNDEIFKDINNVLEKTAKLTLKLNREYQDGERTREILTEIKAENNNSLYILLTFFMSSSSFAVDVILSLH
ncbi:MAG: hypothetical protein ACRDDL_01985 [Sarcina sp.]